MIKNKAFQALAISTCLILTSAAGVYADTNEDTAVPAVVEMADPELMYTTTVADQNASDTPLQQMQQEVDKYLFEEHQDELAQLGILVTHTAAMGDYVEIGITPYNEQNAQYLYQALGEDKIKVVEGQQAVPLEQQVTITAEKPQDASFFTKLVDSIVQWFKNIF